VGKSALVTAASDGLGLATAARLAAAGCRVAICGRRIDRLEAARRQIDGQSERTDTRVIQADLAHPEAIEPLFRSAQEQLGGIDILVVNSGHMAYGCFDELDDADWYEGFELVLMSAMRLGRLAARHMRDRVGGDIVFITASGMKEPSPHLVLSNVMRAGLASLARSMAQQVAADNIRVNVVAPGYFDTGRVRRRIDEMAAHEKTTRAEAAKSIAGAIPVGRIGTAEEFAELVAFVVSRRAPYLTGATIVVDGGATRGIF
jgi:3-oxoacyl-[acyl-carrier protein] reductase